MKLHAGFAASAFMLVWSASASAAPKVIDVSIGPGGTCVVREDGAVICWGTGRAFDENGGISMRPHRMGKLVAKKVAVGRDHVCAIDGQGVVHCAGQDDVTAVARGSEQDVPDDAPDPGAVVWRRIPGVPKAVALASGPHHVCALGAVGDVVCWGSTYEGRLGPDNKDGAPARVSGVGKASAIAAADDLTCVLSAEKKVRCFGALDLGEGKPDGRKSVITIPLPPVASMGVGHSLVCGLSVDGLSATCAGDIEAFTGKETPDAVTVKLPEKATRIVSGSKDLCVHGASGKIWCSGESQSLLKRTGELVPGAWEAYATPVAAGTMSYHDLAAIGLDGALLWAGNQRNAPSPPPDVQKVPVQVVGLTKAVELVAGRQHACAKLADGTVSCWGGSWEDSALPRQIPGASEVLALAAGGANTCARKKSGELSCWEPKHYANRHNDQSLHVPSLPGLASVTVGAGHACALDGGGTVSCWGSAYEQALGFKSPEQYPQPVKEPRAIPGLTEVVALDAGSGATCAVRKSGQVRCWGRNVDGLLGQGTQGDAAPIGDVVSLPPAARVSVGGRLACSLGTDKRVSCWGGGALTPVPWPGAADVVSLSVGTRGHSDKYTGACIVRASGHVECGAPGSSRRIKGIDTATSVASGDGFGCALLAEGTVRCWGKRDAGQLGDGRPPIGTRLDPVVISD